LPNALSFISLYFFEKFIEKSDILKRNTMNFIEITLNIFNQFKILFQ